MVPNEELHILTIHFEPPKRGQPLYKGQNAWSQGVLYVEVPLYLDYNLCTYSGTSKLKTLWGPACREAVLFQKLKMYCIYTLWKLEVSFV